MTKKELLEQQSDYLANISSTLIYIAEKIRGKKFSEDGVTIDWLREENEKRKTQVPQMQDPPPPPDRRKSNESVKLNLTKDELEWIKKALHREYSDGPDCKEKVTGLLMLYFKICEILYELKTSPLTSHHSPLKK